MDPKPVPLNFNYISTVRVRVAAEDMKLLTPPPHTWQTVQKDRVRGRWLIGASSLACIVASAPSSFSHSFAQATRMKRTKQSPLFALEGIVSGCLATAPARGL